MLLDRYIARLMFIPLVATLVITASLLLLVRMAELLDLVVGEGGTGGTVLHLLSNLTPQYVAFGIPLGLLMAVLLAFRRLALNSELDAMLGTGVSYLRMLKVPMLFSAACSLLTLVVVGYAQPLSSYDQEKLMFDLQHGVLGVSIKVGEFTPLGNGIVVRVEKSSQGGRDLQRVFASTTDADGRTVVIFAARGALVESADGRSVIVRLFDGNITRVDAKSAQGQSGAFETYEIPLSPTPAPAFRTRGEREREMTLSELVEKLRDPSSAETVSNEAKAGVYRRAAQVLVLFFLPLLAMALARPPLRSASGMRLFFALAGFIIYNELSLFGERLGFSGQAQPFEAQAVSFVAFAAACVVCFVYVAFSPGARLFSLRARTVPQAARS